MKNIGLLLLPVLAILAHPFVTLAQNTDPSEVFLKAYMTAQQAEKLERENQLKPALSKLRFAGSLLEEVKKNSPDWQPAIVDYRGRKIGGSILRVQSKISTQNDLSEGAAEALASAEEPSLPSAILANGNISAAQPNIDGGAPSKDERAAEVQSAIQGATKELRARVESLERDLRTSRQQVDAAQKEKQEISGQLQETGAELEQARTQIAKTRKAEADVRFQLTEMKKSFAGIQSSNSGDQKAALARQGEINQLKKALEVSESGRIAAEKETAAEQAKLAGSNQKVANMSKERDAMPQERTNASDSIQWVKENQMLRGIVIRERQEEARREQAKKLMLAEFDKLKIKSDVLDQQIHLLAEPITKLSEEELALLKAPVVAISDAEPRTIKASLTSAKPSGGSPSPEGPPVTITDPPPPPTQGAMEADTAASGALEAGSDPPGPAVGAGFKPGERGESLLLAREAKDSFDRGKFQEAERQYEEILAKSPNDIYSLSNLGVVFFRNGKLKAAEQTLKRAIELAPKDEFTHTTLGVVYYRQGKFDDALSELTKSLAINPKSATAHNYLGITASQKGWQEAAVKEMLEAIANNPEYADAHFNLAVVYSTSHPPAKALARRHYEKALALGAQPDPTLDKLLGR